MPIVILDVRMARWVLHIWFNGWVDRGTIVTDFVISEEEMLQLRTHRKCPINWDAHNRAIRNATINEFYRRIKAEHDPSLEYVDWDSIEAVFIRLRGEE